MIRTALLLFAFAMLLACNRSNENKQVPARLHQESTIEFPAHFESAWVMSSGWSGYMGVAIAISGDRYFYWMYSDAGPGHEHPYTGSFRIDGDSLILEQPTSLSAVPPLNEVRLYSSLWQITRTSWGTRLHSSQDRPDDEARSLIQDFQFDPRRPFRNQDFLNP